jgi:hypothetical protein
MMMMMLSLVLCSCCLLALWGTARAKAGVDLSVVTDAATWDCLVSNNVEFAIIRAYRSLGQVDSNAPTSVSLALKAGVKSVDAYMFPCITSSSYAVSHNITCDSAEKQVADTLSLLSTTSIGRMWIDVEDESPSKYYDSNGAVNQAFMEQLVAALVKSNVAVGIYTTKTYWSQIMNNDMNYGQYPLWYPRYGECVRILTGLTADRLYFCMLIFFNVQMALTVSTSSRRLLHGIMSISSRLLAMLPFAPFRKWTRISLRKSNQWDWFEIDNNEFSLYLILRSNY